MDSLAYPQLMIDSASLAEAIYRYRVHYSLCLLCTYILHSKFSELFITLVWHACV